MTEMLGGIVELDETYIGGKQREHVPQATKPGVRPKDNPGPFGGKAAVVSVLQRGDSVRSHHIKPIIEEMVAPDAHLMTDSPTVLKSAGRVRRHSQVNHKANEYVRMEGGTCITTNTVDGYFAILKRENYGVYHHWSQKYLGQYLREFDWRYNVRGKPDVERVIIALKMVGGKRLMLRPPSQSIEVK